MTSWIVLGSKTFLATPDNVADARRFTAETLPIADRSDTAVLLISERFTNSVLHSDSRFGGEITVMLFEVGAALRGRRRRRDDGADPPRRQRTT